jgi:anion-transporting  ArsA/GET3 family ATPase
MIVGGKGGVGRSTVAAALALAAARQGRRTLVAELSGRHDVAHALGARTAGPGLEEVRLRRDLYHVSIERQAALRDYLSHEVPGPLPVGRLTRSRTFSLFIDATPGMGELLSIGKVWELAGSRRRRSGARSYDLVVLDGPASGQMMGLLRAPGTFGAIARLGPVAHQTKGIEGMLTDHGQTAVTLVTTPEQMAVSEILALRTELDEAGLALDQVVINRALSWPFSCEQEEALNRAGGDDPALVSVRWLSERVHAQRGHLSRLRGGLAGVPQTTLPLVYGGIDLVALDELSVLLAEEPA